MLSAKLDAQAVVQATKQTLSAQHGPSLNIVGTHIQRRGVSRSPSAGGATRLAAAMHPAMYFGLGSVQVLADLVAHTQADAVLVLNPLSDTQRARLTQAVGCAVRIWVGPQIR